MKSVLRITVSVLILLLAGCSATSKDRNKVYSPAPYRLKIERPGEGAKLENELAQLMLANKRIQAMRLCNDILFSSRSKKDRETANYWRTILMAMEEIDESNYPKAIEVLKKGSKWWNSSTMDYHSKLVIKLLGKLKEEVSTIKKMRSEIKDSASSKKELILLNQELNKELAEIKQKNEELEKLLEKLEKVK